MYFKQILIGMIFCAVALHAAAQISFTKTYPTPESSRGIDVVKTSDGGYLIAGDTIRSSSESDIYLIKTDSLGELEWTNTFGLEEKEERVSSILRTSDNGYLITGSVRYNEFYSYPLVYKVDSVGEIIWARDTISNFGSGINGAIETNDGGYLLGGGGHLIPQVF